MRQARVGRRLGVRRLVRVGVGLRLRTGVRVDKGRMLVYHRRRLVGVGLRTRRRSNGLRLRVASWVSTRRWSRRRRSKRLRLPVVQRGELRRRGDERLSNVGERIGCRSAVRGHLHRPAHARLLLRLSRSRSSVALRHVARERPVRIHAHPPEGRLSSPVGVLVPERTLFVVFVVFGRTSVPGSTLGARWR